MSIEKGDWCLNCVTKLTGFRCDHCAECLCCICRIPVQHLWMWIEMGACALLAHVHIHCEHWSCRPRPSAPTWTHDQLFHHNVVTRGTLQVLEHNHLYKMETWGNSMYVHKYQTWDTLVQCGLMVGRPHKCIELKSSTVGAFHDATVSWLLAIESSSRGTGSSVCRGLAILTAGNDAVPLYWLFNRDPYHGSWNNPYIYI